MDLSHEVRGSGRARRAGLVSVLASSVAISSMSGCGAALIAGAGYLAAEEIAQSNVEAARIRAQGQANVGARRYDQAEQESKMQESFKAWMQELQRPKVFACNYVDASLDGNASFVSEDDFIGRRTSLPALFKDDEPICFSAFVLGDYSGKKSALRLVNSEGLTLSSDERVIDHSEGCFGGIQYKPGELAPGHYKFVWHLDGNFAGSVEAEVRSGSSVLTQK
ncbi:MAG: hypothetical protein AABX53_04290 [Nanoarchaeota archaeon]